MKNSRDLSGGSNESLNGITIGYFWEVRINRIGKMFLTTNLVLILEKELRIESPLNSESFLFYLPANILFRISLN
ncbi:MAG: hypothetical protein JJE53_02670 [Candidatus Pacebacteria bacterium]|nr:hypothetical protein [Candidatus Paceibacterota bacterium]